MKKLFFTLLIVFFFQVVNAHDPSVNSRNLTIKLPLSSLAGDSYAERMGIGI